MYVRERTFYTDVCVIGGGSAGCSAAVQASRCGLDTILIEQQQSLGGLLTNALVSGLAGLREGNAGEFTEMLEKEGLTTPSWLCPVVDAERAKLVLENYVHNAGVRILYNMTAYDVVSEDGFIKEVNCVFMGTKVSIKARMYIDATGDASVAAMAGAPVAEGGAEFSGINSASSLHLRIAHVNLVKYREANASYKQEQADAGVPEEDRIELMTKVIREAAKRGEITDQLAGYLKRTGGRQVPSLDPKGEEDATVLMILHCYNCRNTDPEDFTRQLYEQHTQAWMLEKILKKYCPGWEGAGIVTVAPMLGIRDSRRIIGEYVFNDADLAGQHRFEDSICRFDDMFDLHHPVTPTLVMRHGHVRKPEEKGFYRKEKCDINMHPFGYPEGFEARTDPKGYCEVPYKAIVPKKVKNLFAVGRCFSVGFDTLGGIRLVATCMSLGQAAGVAAKLCFDNDCTPAELDGKLVHKYLMEECGIPLESVTGRLITKAETKGEPYISPADSIKYR